MIGKNKIKLIKSLAYKKHRLKEQSFLAEGDKTVIEILKSNIQVNELFATPEFITANINIVSRVKLVTETAAGEIKKASLLKQPQNSLAVCALPAQNRIPEQLNGFYLFLDEIQDPGNLGTIIRTCDWFGADYLFCSPDTADVFNPKVIQATMGSFLRVKTVYTQFDLLLPFIQKSGIPVYGTFLDGNPVYLEKPVKNALIVLGNESKGISSEVAKQVDKKIKIPSFGGAESLNVAVSAGIICNEFLRNEFLTQNEKPV